MSNPTTKDISNSSKISFPPLYNLTLEILIIFYLQSVNQTRLYYTV